MRIFTISKNKIHLALLFTFFISAPGQGNIKLYICKSQAIIAESSAFKNISVAFFFILAVALLLSLIIKLALEKKFRTKLYAVQLQEAVLKERNRIAADMHDDIGAELTNIAVLSKILKQAAASNSEESLKIATKIETSSNQVITKINETIWILNAPNHSLKNLAAHIRSYAASLCDYSLTPLIIHINDTIRIPVPLTAEFTRDVFLLTKELLQNAIKHSGATHITLHFYMSGFDRLCISYGDDGVGFNTAKIKKGNGIDNIRRRVANHKGAVTIASVLKQGCSIKIILPLSI